VRPHAPSRALCRCHTACQDLTPYASLAGSRARPLFCVSAFAVPAHRVIGAAPGVAHVVRQSPRTGQALEDVVVLIPRMTCSFLLPKRPIKRSQE